MNRKILPLTLLGTALFLGACGQAPVTQQTPNTPVTSSKLVPLKLSAPFGKSAKAIGPQALPGGAGGAPVVNVIKVKVYKQGQSTPLTFNDGGSYDTEGTHSYLTLRPDNLETEEYENWTSILLPAGDYDVESVGLVDTTDNEQVDGVFFAYGMSDDLSLRETKNGSWGGGAELDLELHTLTDEDNSSLESYYPHQVVTTDQQVSLRLKLRSKSIGNEAVQIQSAGGMSTMAAGANFPVPSSDYSYDYEAGAYTFDSVVGGSVDSSNQYGAKVRTPSELAEIENSFADTFTVSANVWGWVETGTEKAQWQALNPIQYKVPLANGSELSNDLTPPVLTVAADGGLGGTVSDNMMLKMVRVFDGSTLIGQWSADEEITAADDVSSITIDEGGNWTLEREFDKNGTYDITVIATDAADNESQVEGTFTGTQLVPDDVTAKCQSATNIGGVWAGANVPANSDGWYKQDFTYGAYPYGQIRLRSFPSGVEVVAVYYLDGTPATLQNNAFKLSPSTGMTACFHIKNTSSNPFSGLLWDMASFSNNPF